MLREFGLPDDDAGLLALRRAALQHPDIPIHQRFNRARRGVLRVGDAAPSTPLAPLRPGAPPATLSALQVAGTPLVIMAGSIS